MGERLDRDDPRQLELLAARSRDAWRVIQNTMVQSRWSNIPYDQYPAYVAEYEDIRRGSTMPASHLIRSKHLKYFTDMDEDGKWQLNVEAKFLTSDYAKDLLEEFPIDSDHMVVRSRGVTLASSALRKNELDRRIGRRIEFDQYVNKVAEAAEGKFDQLLEQRRALIEQYSGLSDVDKYVSEHRRSSIMPGIKWADLEPGLDEMREDLFTLVYENAVNMPEGQYFAHAFNQGLRSRALPLSEAETQYDGEIVTMKGIIQRTRIIMFHPALSMTNLIIENKPAYYREWVNWAKDVLGIQSDVYSPLVDGGMVYKIASDQLGKGLIHKALDGVNHESNVITILGKSSYAFGTGLKGQIHLPSGIAETSLYGLLVTLVYLSELEKIIGPCVCVVLGDDLNLFLTEAQVSALDSSYLISGGILKEDEDDSKMNYMLGLVIDPDRQGLIGFKFMQDDAEHMIGVKNLDDGVDAQRKKIDLRTALNIYEGHHGRLNGRKIIDVMCGIEAGYYQGPGHEINKVLEDPSI